MISSFGIWDQLVRSWAIVKKDMRIYYSKGQVILMGLLWPGFMFLSFAFGRQMSAETLMPGLIGVTVFFTCSAMSPIIFPLESQSRTLERMISCPVSVWTILLGDLIASALTGLIITIVPVVIALALGVPFTQPLMLAVGIILSALCFSAMALIFSFPATSSPAPIQMLSTLIKFPLMFISGIFIPLSELPAAARGISFISPLTYFTDLARGAMGGSSYYPAAINLVVILAFTVIFWTIAVSLHSRSLPKRV
jgi:ABC-2 type transport system permease protein